VVCLLAVSAGCVKERPPVMSPLASGSCRASSFRWIGPNDAHNRARLDSWCAGVGVPIIHDGSQHSAVRLSDVTFVSWNVHVGNGDIASFISDLKSGALTNGAPVTDFVLMLQEVVRDGDDVPAYSAGASSARRIDAPRVDSNDIFAISRQRGLSLIYVPSMRNGWSADRRAADRGSAIVSTLPLSNPVAVELPGERQRRVAIFATLGAAAPPGEHAVSVGVVHLDALGASNRLWLFGTPFMRELQVKSLGSVLPSQTLVLGADLNTWHGPGEPAPRELATMFGEESPAKSGGFPTRVLDYLFFRLPKTWTAVYAAAAKSYGSDHRPLVGRIVSS
jgi:hypothetical protein